MVLFSRDGAPFVLASVLCVSCGPSSTAAPSTPIADVPAVPTSVASTVAPTRVEVVGVLTINGSSTPSGGASTSVRESDGATWLLNGSAALWDYFDGTRVSVKAMRPNGESSVLDVVTLHLVDELDAFPSWASVHEEQVIEGVVHDVERADGSIVGGSAVFVAQSGTEYVLLNATDPHMPRRSDGRCRRRS